ncbi:MAG: hydroxymethylglutaryl-CoA reductase, degradative [Nanoarchaeota archaeon]
MRLPKFYERTVEERLQIIASTANLSDEELSVLEQNTACSPKVENVISGYTLPLGIAPNFVINGKERLVPMAIEEASVIAGAAKAAKLCQGFEANVSSPIMTGQIILDKVPDMDKAIQTIKRHEPVLLSMANDQDPILVKHGGGAKELEPNIVGQFLVFHLHVDVKDAMGANAVNTMSEAIAPLMEELTGGKARGAIITNLALKRMVNVKGVWNKEAIGSEGIKAVLDLYQLAKDDPARAVTNNKGIMNSIDAVAIATGNDFRALEAGAHGYAGLNEGYQPLASYSLDKEGNLVGELRMPLAVGTVGGSTSHPMAKICRKIMGVTNARELAEVMASVGLANNFAALLAIGTEGIQKGHMRLHKKVSQ